MPLVVQVAQYICVAAGCGATWRILPMFLARQLTPSAAAHTYSIRAFLSAAGTYTFAAGAGGSGVTMPGFIKIIRA